MKVELIITRKVLIEKYSIKQDSEWFFLSFLDGCEIKLNEKFPDSLFYVKDGLCLFAQILTSKFFFVSYDVIWSIFYEKYGFSYAETNLLINGLLKEHLKLYDYIPVFNSSMLTEYI